LRRPLGGGFRPSGSNNAQAFTDVLQALGVPAARAIIIGDNFEEDILGGRRVGLRGVFT
jgi:FMN phosphatase YigB (HAD superfamily)